MKAVSLFQIFIRYQQVHVRVSICKFSAAGIQDTVVRKPNQASLQSVLMKVAVKS